MTGPTEGTISRTIPIVDYAAGREMTVTIRHDPRVVDFELSLTTGRGIDLHAQPYLNRPGMADSITFIGLSLFDLRSLALAIRELALEHEKDSEGAELTATEAQQERRKDARQRFASLEDEGFIRWIPTSHGYLLSKAEGEENDTTKRFIFDKTEAVDYLEKHPEVGAGASDGMAHQYRRLEYMLENELAWWSSDHRAYVAWIPGGYGAQLVVELGKSKDEAVGYLFTHPDFLERTRR